MDNNSKRKRNSTNESTFYYNVAHHISIILSNAIRRSKLRIANNDEQHVLHTVAYCHRTPATVAIARY